MKMMLVSKNDIKIITFNYHKPRVSPVSYGSRLNSKDNSRLVIVLPVVESGFDALPCILYSQIFCYLEAIFEDIFSHKGSILC